jgi:hypothetical protein
MVPYNWDSSIGEAEAGGFRIQGQLELHSGTISEIKNKNEEEMKN